MTTYTMRDEGTEEACTATTLAEAKAEAIAWAEGGEYGEIERTIWTDVYLYEDGEEVARVTAQIDPRAPKCARREGHEWASPYDLVGGDKRNPGVHGHGGGVIITDVCGHCGCERVRDTWAQRPDTGEQGLESVRYEAEKYTDEIAALRDEGVAS